jgi:hypothetical protein
MPGGDVQALSWVRWMMPAGGADSSAKDQWIRGRLDVLEQKWPVMGGHGRAVEWLQMWADLGGAPGTIDPVTANRAHVAAYVQELTQQPRRLRRTVVSIDSGVG